MQADPAQFDALAPAEVLRLVSAIVVGVTLLMAAAASYFLERRHGQRPMFALTLVLISWVMLTLGTALSGVGRIFPPILVAAPLFSGFIGPALYIYTRQVTQPERSVSLKWLFLGGFGTVYSVLSLTLPGGLDFATESIVHNRPYWHPILSPPMVAQSIQLVIFVVLSTALITRAVWSGRHPDLKQRQFWLFVTCWTCVLIVILTSVLPNFGILLTGVQPALVTLPIAVVGCLSVRALGAELGSAHASRIEVRTNRMESLGRMARGMAHDLNNVLTGVVGHAEMARVQYADGKPVEPHLEQIIEGSQRASELLNRMMTYSGRVDRVGDPVDPRTPIEAAFQAIAPLQESSVQMRIELDAELPSVCIDPAALSSVVDNLLVNATQALEGREGRITLRAVREEVSTLPPDTIGSELDGVACLRVEVEDNGVGMTPAQASRALEPFYSSRAEGKGLGLVGVLSTIKGACGALWFSSTEGSGTRFVFWLPEAAELSSPPESFGEHIPCRVLVVDDEPDIARVFVEFLKALGMEVSCVQSGEAAIALLTQPSTSAIDLAVVDIRLGEMDGIELGHRLLHDHGCSRILLISGDEPGPRLAQFEGQPMVFRRKPLTLQDLREALAALDISTPEVFGKD